MNYTDEALENTVKSLNNSYEIRQNVIDAISESSATTDEKIAIVKALQEWTKQL